MTSRILVGLMLSLAFMACSNPASPDSQSPPIPSGDGITYTDADQPGYYVAETVSNISTLPTVARVIGKVSLSDGQIAHVLISNCLQSTECSGVASEELPGNLGIEFGFPNLETWIGPYSVATTGKTWVWEITEEELNDSLKDSYLHVLISDENEPLSAVQFQNIPISLGNTVALPEIELPYVRKDWRKVPWTLAARTLMKSEN